MGLDRRRLRGLIELIDLRNEDGRLVEKDVVGVSTEKCMITTKANLQGVNLCAYKLFPPNSFAYVADTSRRGNKIALAYNNTTRTFIVSTWYVVFAVCESARDLLSSDYLFLYFNRPEFDRYARTNSWGSAREYFWFDDMEDIEISLPSIEVQRKYVAIYEAMLANQRAYEHGLDDLKLACDALLDRCKDVEKRIRVGDCLNVVDRRNEALSCGKPYGININKEFMASNASSGDLRRYKLVAPGQLAYSSMQTGRDRCIRIALNESDFDIVVSPAYDVLDVKQSVIDARYFMMWFSRAESDRYGWFQSDSSIRANLDLDRFFDTEIPYPDSHVQNSLAELYSVLRIRRTINDRLKQQLKEICPILIKGSIEEAKQ